MLITVIISSVLLAICIVVVNILYRKSNAYKNQLLPARKQMLGVPHNLQFVNFGSTYTMYAFNSYDELQLNGFSFAMEAQSLEIDNVLLHKYADHIQEGATVVIGLAACVSYYRYKMVSDTTMYYELLNKSEIPFYSIKKSLKKYVPITPRSWRKIKKLIKDDDLRCDVVDNFPSTCSDEKAKSNMKGMAEGWIKLFHLKDLKHPTTDADNLKNLEFNAKLLKSMIAFCKERKWNPIFVIAPFSAELNQYFSDDFVKSVLYQLMAPSVEEYQVPIYDYRSHESFQYDKASFVDGGFRLSKYGSRKFMRTLMFDISRHQYNNEKFSKYGINR